MIYLDNSATTKIDERVAKEMIPFLFEEYGNPSSKYYQLAQNAKSAVENSRKKIAELLNCDSEEIIFNSGASEGNNHIIKGIADFYSNKGKHMITSQIEHKSILEVFKFLEKKGFEVTYLKPNNTGTIDPEELEKAIRKDTILISIMWGNNEIGTLNDIETLNNIARKNKIFFHTDATQVVGKINIDLKKLNIDFLTMSAHKINGPKGIGALYVKNDDLGLPTMLTPLIHGGDQERGDRGGTHSVHNIVGIGKAAEICENEMKASLDKIKSLETLLKEELKNNLPRNIEFNGDLNSKIPGVLSLSIEGVNNELLLKKLKDKVAISTGSACNIRIPSYVLKAIGKNEKEIMQTIRISIGKFNTEEDIKEFVRLLKFHIEG